MQKMMVNAKARLARDGQCPAGSIRPPAQATKRFGGIHVIEAVSIPEPSSDLLWSIAKPAVQYQHRKGKAVSVSRRFLFSCAEVSPKHIR